MAACDTSRLSLDLTCPFDALADRGAAPGPLRAHSPTVCVRISGETRNSHRYGWEPRCTLPTEFNARGVIKVGMTRHRSTTALVRLVRELRSISKEIEPELHLVSQAARDEWKSRQYTWPSDSELREGATAFTEDQLEAISAKVRRFRNIVHSLAPKASPIERVHSIDDEAPTFRDLPTTATSSLAHFGPRRAARRGRRAPPKQETPPQTTPQTALLS